MKSLRLLALACVLGLTSWTSMQSRAEAHNYPQCTSMEASPCSQPDATTQCWMAPYACDVRTCICMSDRLWHCPIFGTPAGEGPGCGVS